MRDQVEAGCELTYDYGATSSAGGTISQGNDRVRNSNDSPQQQLMSKRPRRSSALVPVESTSSGALPSMGCDVLSPGDEGAPQVEQTGGNTQQPPTPRGSEDRGRSDDNVVRQSLSARRACLCGSQHCRGLLPCNRAIL